MTTGTKVLAAALALAAMAAAGPARAEGWADRLSLGGSIQSDIRFIADDWRGERPGEGHEFEMNRNDVNLRLRADPFDNVQAVVDTRLRYYGFNRSASLPELIGRSKIDPFDVQLNEAYVAVRGLPWSKMDIKVGRMIQTWGTADMFNPTDNLNSRDFSDPLDYAGKVPNQMLELDFYPTDWLSLQLVWVPVFKPANLPPSAVQGFAMTYDECGDVSDFPAPPLDEEGRVALANLKSMLGGSQGQKCGNKVNPMADVGFTTPEVRTINPKPSLANSQFGARAKFKAGPVDFSLSYYYGRFGFPVAANAVADVIDSSNYPTTTKFVTDTESIDTSKSVNVRYVAEIMYPRMQVVGADFAYASENQWVPGFFAEAALIFPERVDFGLDVLYNGQTTVPLAAMQQMFDSNGDKVQGFKLPYRNVNVPSTPFIKATAGLDWSYRDWFYLNLQYVRGFFDEFNDMYGIHNYFVFATEAKFKQNEVQIRFAGALNCDDQSAVLYPQVTWIVAPAVELVAGYMHFLGDTETPAGGTSDRYFVYDPVTKKNVPAPMAANYASKSKFGMKANGRNVAFLRGKVTF